MHNTRLAIPLLQRYTKQPWRAIPTNDIQPHGSAVCVTPAQLPHSITPAMCYIPAKSHHATTHDIILQHLQAPHQLPLAMQPAIKYNLNGINLATHNVIETLSGLTFVLQGTLSLTGNLVIKPLHASPTITLSTRDFRSFSISAKQTRDQFVQSLKVSDFEPGLHPRFSIGSSYTDSVTLTASSIRVQMESANRFTISASLTPNNRTRLVLPHCSRVIEYQMGYLFSGTVTVIPDNPLPSSATHHSLTKSIIIGGGVMVGAIIVTVLSGGTDLIVAGGVAGTGALAATQ